MSTEEQKKKAREYSRKWRAANPERRIAASRRQYAANAESRRERSRLYRLNNPEKVSAMNKRWRTENPERAEARNREWKLRNPDKVKIGNQRRGRIFWLKKYGITAADYDRMFLAQDGKCGICCRETTSLCVDHNHESGVVRGLLCRTCNSAIGLLGENVGTILAAAGYLRAHEHDGKEFRA